MLNQPDLSTTLLDWSSTFIRLSLHDFVQYARSAGLSLAQMTVLIHLFYQGPNEVTHFCDMMQVTPAGASQMIERMVQLGVVQRVEITGDRRVRLVELTDQGRQIVLDSLSARRMWVDQLVGKLSEEDRQRIGEALETLNTLAGTLEIAHPNPHAAHTSG